MRDFLDRQERMGDALQAGKEPTQNPSWAAMRVNAGHNCALWNGEGVRESWEDAFRRCRAKVSRINPGRDSARLYRCHLNTVRWRPDREC
jgi:hypothetical protein